MKMRKLISLILAAGVVATSMATVASATTAPAKMKAEVTKYVAEEGNKIYDFYDGYMGEQPEIPDGGAMYLVEFKVANLTLGRINKTSSTDPNPRLKAFELYYAASDVSNIDSIVAYEDNETDATAEKIQFIPTVARLNGSNFEVKAADTTGKGLWPTTLVTPKAYTDADPTVALCGALITVKDESKQVVFTEVKNTTSSETLLYTYAYNGGTADATNDGRYTAPAGTFALETITLGEATAKDPESVTITGDAAAIKVGDTKALTATVAPSEADQTITWTSDNTAVATVANGTVTAVAPGKATITAASSKAGVAATFVVKVLPKVTGADDVAEYEGTYIWKNVTINGAKYGTNYEVTFAADGAEKTKALDISAIEVGGDVSFPILLKGAPAAPTATIGCDWIDAQ